MGGKYRGGFSLLVPLWDDGIQFSTWHRANALAHDDGMFTLWTTPDGNVCMYVWNLPAQFLNNEECAKMGVMQQRNVDCTATC